MLKLPPDGYRFRYGRPDVNLAGGVRQADVLAIATSLNDAEMLAGDCVGDPSALRLIERGPTVLAEAEALGLSVGEAKHL